MKGESAPVHEQGVAEEHHEEDAAAVGNAPLTAGMGHEQDGEHAAERQGLRVAVERLCVLRQLGGMEV